MGRDGLEQRAGVRARAHQVPEVDVGLGRADRVVEVGQPEVVAVLVGDDADAGVLGLRGVVEDLDAGARDLVAARRRVDAWAGGPLGVGPLLAAVVGLVGAGVDHHDVVDDAVGLEQVAVAVPVALVLEVVVGPGEVGVGGRSASTASIAIWPVPRGLSGWPMSLAAPASHESAEYHASECGSISHGVTVPPTSYLPLDISS